MRQFFHLAFSLILSLLSIGAQACAICAPSDAQNTVMARLRGTVPLVIGQTPDRWTLGPLTPASVAWAQQALALSADADSRAKNAVFFVRHLENPDPIIAQAAYEEVAARPYPELRGLAKSLDANRVHQWVQQPALRPRWPLYLLLHGFTGNTADATAIERRLLAPDTARTPSELSAWLAAYLEIKGPAGIEWVERNVLPNQTMPDADMQAALLALSVHGNDGARISKSRVAQAYARFIQANPQRAGFVALDLANWGNWEFAEAFAAALRSGQQQVFSSRYAMVFYLLRNPRPEARALMDALKAEKLI